MRGSIVRRRVIRRHTFRVFLRALGPPVAEKRDQSTNASHGRPPARGSDQESVSASPARRFRSARVNDSPIHGPICAWAARRVKDSPTNARRHGSTRRSPERGANRSASDPNEPSARKARSVVSRPLPIIGHRATGTRCGRWRARPIGQGPQEAAWPNGPAAWCPIDQDMEAAALTHRSVRSLPRTQAGRPIGGTRSPDPLRSHRCRGRRSCPLGRAPGSECSETPGTPGPS